MHSPCPRPQFPDSIQWVLQAEALIIPCSWLDAPHPTPPPNSLLQDHLNPPTFPYVSTWFGISTTEVLKATTEAPTQRRKDSFLTRGLKEQWGQNKMTEV